MTLRSATVDDIDVILHHRVSMFSDMGYTHELPDIRTITREYLEQAIPNGSYKGWLLEIDNRVVAGGGVVIVHWPGAPNESKPHRAWILNIYTEPEYRRQGLAKKIMEALIGYCREAGFAQVSLHASVHGRALYESLGFLPTNEMRLRLDQPKSSPAPNK